LFLIKPTRYDEDGYPVQWLRSIIPSNSLACVAGIVDDALARDALGPDITVVSHAIDETNTKVDVDAILKQHRTPNTRVLVFLIGVQTNQYPRALDIARPLRAAGVPVCIGGFHVSGCIAMLGADAPELSAARDLGLSMFAGEAEQHRIDEVLRDGYGGSLKPLYNHLADMPGMQGAPMPILDGAVVRRTITHWSSFDLGRGCPFECSFCTIINVQGRKSRFRTADDLEAIVRANLKNGVSSFFVTDDNFARNRNWEAYADRLIEMQERDNIRVRMIIQVDTMAHRIPGFIDKIFRAGAHLVFIGLENINPDNLESVKKRQNRIEEYREMLLAWKRHAVVVICSYIIGFPHDTRASILRDVETIKRELPIDLFYLNMLTPLPGSEDHKKMRAAGVWMDSDFNKYDLNHRVIHHERMSDREFEEVFWEAHAAFYTFEHMDRIFKRMVALRNGMRFTTLMQLMAYREGPRLERAGFSECGVIRVVRRRQRRFGLPIESPFVFYPRVAWRFTRKTATYATTYIRLRFVLARAWRSWERTDIVPYTDAAIAPATGPVDGIVSATAGRSTPYAQRRIETRMRSRHVN
jgi:pyruvate-formate lyase-activating enzyme